MKIYKYTDEEIQEKNQIREFYKVKINAARKRMRETREDHPYFPPAMFPDDTTDLNADAEQMDGFIKAMNKWEKEGSAEWREAYEEYGKESRACAVALSEFETRAADRQFNEIAAGGPDAIVKDAERQIEEYLKDAYNAAHNAVENGADPDGVPGVSPLHDAKGFYYLDADFLELDLQKNVLRRHRDALAGTDKAGEVSRLVGIADKKSPYLLTPINPAMKNDDDAAELVKALDKVHSFAPDLAEYPNDKASRYLLSGRLVNGRNPLRVQNDKHGNPVAIAVFLDLNGLPGTSLDRNLNRYDNEVLRAVVSLYRAGNMRFTVQMIYRAMTGNPTARVTPTAAKEIQASMERLRNTSVAIQDPRFTVNNKPIVYRDKVISCASAAAEINGQRVECYELHAVPILYTYASKVKQVSRVDITMYNVPVPATRENVILTGYLVEQIQAMYYSPRRSHFIKYETIYNILGIREEPTATNRNKRRKIRDTVKKILTYWRGRDYIGDFSEYPDDRQIKTGVKIDLPSRSRRAISADEEGNGGEEDGDK